MIGIKLSSFIYHLYSYELAVIYVYLTDILDPRTLSKKLSELEAACRRRRRSLGQSSLFELEETEHHIEQVLSASIKSVKTIASGIILIVILYSDL